jgi:hypothetical protein
MTPRPSPADEPMVRGFQGVQRLPGFSGADVFLLSRKRGPWFVRKAARTPLGNMRLQRQAAKQIAFAERRMLPVRTPRVLDEGAIAERTSDSTTTGTRRTTAIELISSPPGSSAGAGSSGHRPTSVLGRAMRLDLVDEDLAALSLPISDLNEVAATAC